MTESAGTKRVFFHVGAPKTGTTYLQNVLYRNREMLAGDGVLYPYTDPSQHFRSMQDFRAAGWGGGPASVFAGEWDIVAQRAREWSGHTVIFSNELLGGAPLPRIQAGLASVGPAEAHVVFTARDFARQIVSDWQEHVKHRHQVTLERFVDDLVELGLDAPAPFGELFWGMHDATHVLGRWGKVVPVSRIHIVTVAQPGDLSDSLWQRFCAVTGLDPKAYVSDIPRANRSMGVAETELVRRLNREVKGMAPEVYDSLVRQLLAEETLGGQSAKLMLPPSQLDWMCRRSRRLIDELTEVGYPVEGDLEELMPRPEQHAGYTSPTEQTSADLADAAIRAATALLRQAGRQRRRIIDLKQQLEGAPPAVPRRPSVRDRSRDLYWKVRGRIGRIVKRR